MDSFGVMVRVRVGIKVYVKPFFPLKNRKNPRYVIRADLISMSLYLIPDIYYIPCQV